MVVIIPAAGKGTRMQEVTHGGAKELLKLGHKTVLERIVEEGRLCDPSSIIVVGSPSKPELSLYATELGAKIEFQLHPNGLADAILSASVEDDAVILYGDCVFAGGSPAPRMAELIRKGIDGCIAVEPTDDEGTRLYGIVEVDEFSGAVRRVIEKPGPEQTKSRWAIAARVGCSVRMMAFIGTYVSQHPAEDGKELSLTPIFNAAIEDGFDLKAVPLQPGQERVDCGSPEDYRRGRWLQWD